jgi:hypothetical protein
MIPDNLAYLRRADGRDLGEAIALTGRPHHARHHDEAGARRKPNGALRSRMSSDVPDARNGPDALR